MRTAEHAEFAWAVPELHSAFSAVRGYQQRLELVTAGAPRTGAPSRMEELSRKRFLTAVGLVAAMGGVVIAQRAAPQVFPPGFVDPKPILDAAIKAIGNDK